jgi:hypothetical protein
LTATVYAKKGFTETPARRCLSHTTCSSRVSVRPGKGRPLDSRDGPPQGLHSMLVSKQLLRIKHLEGHSRGCSALREWILIFYKFVLSGKSAPRTPCYSTVIFKVNKKVSDSVHHRGHKTPKLCHIHCPFPPTASLKRVLSEESNVVYAVCI